MCRGITVELGPHEPPPIKKNRHERRRDTVTTHILESHDHTFCGLSSLMIRKHKTTKQEQAVEIRYRTAPPEKATCPRCTAAFYIAKRKSK